MRIGLMGYIYYIVAAGATMPIMGASRVAS